MLQKLYTLRGKHSGRFYSAVAPNFHQACKTVGISPKDLILERSVNLPYQLALIPPRPLDLSHPPIRPVRRKH